MRSATSATPAMKAKAETKSLNLYPRWSLPPSNLQPGKVDNAVAISASVSLAALRVAIVSLPTPRIPRRGPMTFRRARSQTRKACAAAQVQVEIKSAA